MSIFEKWELFFAKKSRFLRCDVNAAIPKNNMFGLTASFFLDMGPTK